MAAEQFQVGDVVQLKSGGPRMTVEEIGVPTAGKPGAAVNCVWFDKVENKKWDSFAPGVLEKVNA